MSKNILILGAGKSTKALVEYLLNNVSQKGYFIQLADIDLAVAEKKINKHPQGKAIQLEQHNETQLETLIQKAEIVVSMLPPSMHDSIAEKCLNFKKHLVTASYRSDAMQKMHTDVSEEGLVFLTECGLDPGIDHMSAMKVIHKVKSGGGLFTGFETFTGGLLAPNQNFNPWNYKFTWNPKNVVMSGQGVVKFIQEGRYKYIPYHRLFRRTERIEIPGYGLFEGYANRDSLKYREIYNLQNIPTIYRGTLRRPGFCKSWDVFVQLGATDDTYKMEGVENMTHRQFINSFLFYHPTDSVELKLAHYLKFDLDGEEIYNLDWLDMFKDIPVGIKEGTPAQILQHILEKKWTMQENDKDLIVMWHKFDYRLNGKCYQMQSSLAFEGKGGEDTAMSFTVGLPVAIAVKLILEGKINSKGVLLPTISEIYEPILEELEEHGLHMQEWMALV